MMEIKLINGNLEISVYDMLAALHQSISDIEDDDDREEKFDELFETLQWSTPAYKKLIQTTRDAFVAENYNSEFYKLFRDFFMFPSKYYSHDAKDDVVYRMNQAMESILKENAELRAENYLLRTARGRLYEWARSNFGDDAAYRINSKLIDFGGADENGKRDFELAREMVKEINYKEVVEEWTETIYKIFNLKETSQE